MQHGIFITHRKGRYVEYQSNKSAQIAKEKCANSYTDYDVLESHDQPHSEETLHIEVFFFIFIITVIATPSVIIRIFVKQLGSQLNEDPEMVSKNNIRENYNNMT